MLLRTSWPIVAAPVLAVALSAGATPQVQRRPLGVDSDLLTRTDAYVTSWMHDGRPLTLFVALHGHGSSADDFASVGADLAAMGLLAVLPQAPHAFDIGNGALGYSWTIRTAGDAAMRDQSRERLVDDQLPALVAQVQERFRVDETYLLGFSQGARMALLGGIRHPDLFSGIVTFGLSGFEEDWVPAPGPDGPRRLPVWMGYGTGERQGVQAANRSTARALEAAGHRVVEHTFDGGHEIPLGALQRAVAWMLSRPDR